ncbi:MAG: peptidase, partial [Bacteroidetes bacterium]|nr:peptidase [Bacteroidota bacterium]
MEQMRRLTLLIILLLTIASGCRKKEDPVKSETQIIPNDLLSADTYKKLTVEVQYIDGYAPSEQSLENMRIFLHERLNKPDGIKIVKKAINSPRKSSYTINEIKEIEKENRTQNTEGSHLTAYFFFADADYAGNSGNSKVLGAAYGKTSMVIFEKTVKDYSGGLTQPPVAKLETTIILHEIAHILGLVNNGTPMETAHQDVNHGKHCNNQKCLMYYTVETTDVVANLLGGDIPVLDAKCIE